MISAADAAKITSDRTGDSAPAPPNTRNPIDTSTAPRTTSESGRIQGARSFDIVNPTAAMPRTVSAVPPAAVVIALGCVSAR